MAALEGIKLLQTIGEIGERAGNQASVVLSVVIKIIVKEVDINSKVLYINVVIIIIIEVGSALALIVTSCYTRFRTTRFYTTSKAVDKGIVVYRHDYILSGFN